MVKIEICNNLSFSTHITFCSPGRCHEERRCTSFNHWQQSSNLTRGILAHQMGMRECDLNSANIFHILHFVFYECNSVVWLCTTWGWINHDKLFCKDTFNWRNLCGSHKLVYLAPLNRCVSFGVNTLFWVFDITAHRSAPEINTYKWHIFSLWLRRECRTLQFYLYVFIICNHLWRF